MKNELSRWEKLTGVRPEQRVYSRSQRIATHGDITNWMKTVEDASQTNGNLEKPNSIFAPETPSYAYDIQDAAYIEAQNLIDQWVNEKLDSDGSIEDDDYVVPTKTRSEIKKEWDHLVDDDSNEFSFDSKNKSKPFNSKHSKGNASSRDPYRLLVEDENSVVESIMNDMLNRDFVSNELMRKMGVSQPNVNPAAKMNLRHAQVKENREKRLQEKMKKLKELQDKKEIQLRARQNVLKEEKEKDTKSKMEEMEIQKVMVQLRKEMENERKKLEEEKYRQKREKEELERRAQEEFERQTEEEKKFPSPNQTAEEKRQRLRAKMEEIQRREMLENLKIKRKYFAAWWKVAVDRHLQIGKIKAMADWKLLFRSFNAWRSHTGRTRINEEASKHAMEVTKMHRMEAIAECHWKRTLMRKILIDWRLAVVEEQHQRQLLQEKNQIKGKMDAFLNAATTGQILKGSERSDEQDGRNSRNTVSSQRPSSAQISYRSESNSARSVPGKGTSHMSKTVTRPTEAWQVTKRHILIADDKISKKNEDENGTSRVGTENTGISNHETDDITSAKTARPKSAYVVNNFEHRHRAQQKMLDVQQQQLKEQQRLIEELQYLQRQQLLHQQLMAQRQIGALGEEGGKKNGSKMSDCDALQLQKHISNLQKTLLDANVDISAVGDGSHRSLTNDSVPVDFQTPKMEPAGAGDASSRVTTRRIESCRSDGSSHRSDGSSHRSDGSSHRSDGSSQVKSSLSIATTSRAPPEDPRHFKFLQAMQERCAEREKLKKEREERKQKLEEERLAKLAKEVEERRLQEEEQKKRRFREYKEKKELEKQKEQQKLKDEERMKELNLNATEHYRLALVNYRGWRPWRKLLEDARNRQQVADSSYHAHLKRKVFTSWRTILRDELLEKASKADQFYQYILLKRCLAAWRRCKSIAMIQDQKAGRHHERSLLLRFIRAWSDHAADEKIADWHRERRADEQNDRRILKSAFETWRKYPAAMKEIAEKEKRLTEMRKRVAALIPDFQPPTPSQSINSELKNSAC